MIKLRRLRCSFCRKPDSQVSKLVAGPRVYTGPRVYICDACVAIANRLMTDSPDNDPPVTAGPGVGKRLAGYIRQLFVGSTVRQVSST